MTKRRRIEHVKIKDLREHEAFKPKADPVFQRLLVEAVRGRVPVYLAAVTLGRVRRFDKSHRPELTVSGGAIVDQIVEAWSGGSLWPLWVYPSGDEFIASDDYFTLAACERERLEVVPCLILGAPPEDSVSILQGPLSVDEIKEALGFK